MNFPVFTTRQWIGIWLCLLGFSIPVFVIIYCILRYKAQPYSYLQILGVLLYQWLPATTLLWLAAAYSYQNRQRQSVAWIIFLIGVVFSLISYLIVFLNH
jgi:chromate transport protein ChrA